MAAAASPEPAEVGLPDGILSVEVNQGKDFEARFSIMCEVTLLDSDGFKKKKHSTHVIKVEICYYFFALKCGKLSL